MKRVAVLMGGITKEREISLKTGAALSAALKRRGYDVIDIDVGRDVVQRIVSANPEAAVIALHGRYGEDGCIQGMLEVMGIPYTGCGVLASAIGMDKVVCATVAKDLGIPMPNSSVYHGSEDIKSFVSKMELTYPVIVKPSREGSTINITIVHNKDDMIAAMKTAFASDNKVLVEEYIKGTEVTIGIINGRALTPLEIAPKSGFYDYKSKYTKGMTEYIVPARIDDRIGKRLQEYSLRLYNALDGAGVARVDFIVRGKDEIYFLEINTIPGMTELSLVPKAAAYEGMSFDDLAEELLKEASLKEGADA